jgi:hypothetical protein
MLPNSKQYLTRAGFSPAVSAYVLISLFIAGVAAPAMKRLIKTYADTAGEKPARVRYCFELGSMLYKEVKSCFGSLISLFIAGVAGIQILSAIAHRYIPSHVVDCAHTHTESETDPEL